MPSSAWPPRWLSQVPAEDVERGDGEMFARLIEQHCRVTKASVAAPAGELIRLRQWQRDLTGALLARRPDGRLRHRMALIGIARMLTGSDDPDALSFLFLQSPCCCGHPVLLRCLNHSGPPESPARDEFIRTHRVFLWTPLRWRECFPEMACSDHRRISRRLGMIAADG